MLLLLLATFAIVAAACGSEDRADSAPAGQPNPTAVPTETPVPLFPITVDMDNEPAAFFAEIPVAERSCLESQWGADRYEAIRSGDERLEDESLDLVRCFSGETFSRVIAGGLFRELGELSDATLACVSEKLRGSNAVTIASSINDLAEDPTLEDFSEISIQIYTEIIPVTFCLNTAERALFNGNGQFGETVSTLECLYDGALSVGEDFGSVFHSGVEPSAEYRQVAVDCGYAIPTPFPSPDPDTGGRGVGTPVVPVLAPEPMPIILTPTP